jgi:Tfp pilus assembly protein PilZ
MLFISFSGGQTSAYMSKFILDSPIFADTQKVFVFANTGKERPETYDFIDKCDKAFGLNLVWVEAVISPEKGAGTGFKIVDFETANRNGKPFADVIAKYGLPHKDTPHCTRELKAAPIGKFALSICPKIDYQMAIGIRADERKRVNRLRAAKEKWIYPLIDIMPATKRDVEVFWAAQSFKLELKNYEGNCDLCWKKSLKKRLKILGENPQIGDQWEEWERADGEYVFDRDNIPILRLRKMAAEQKKQTTINFDDFDNNEPSCSCFF